MGKLLGVNIDHVATLRQARKTVYPEIIEAGLSVQHAGADSITVHCREDLRHIQRADVIALKQCLAIPLNLEMAVTPDMVDFALFVQPSFCCLVPEKRQELTTEGGLDVLAHFEMITQAVMCLQATGIRVSLFIDPEERQIHAAKATGALTIELHTGEYADSEGEAQNQQLQRISQAAAIGVALGLQVNAGHGLNYENTQAIAAISDITELNIGHAIIARAIFIGLAQATTEMLMLCA